MNRAKVYNPETIMDFGINKGENLKEIYLYFPEYLKWLILNVDNFCLKIEEFKCLSLPMPFKKDTIIKLKYNEVFNKFYSQLITTTSFNKPSKDLSDKIFDQANNKTEQYFDIVGLKKENNLLVAKKIITRLKIMPKERPFYFGRECINKNAEKKIESMSLETFKIQSEFILKWKDKIKNLTPALIKLEEEEMREIEKAEEACWEEIQIEAAFADAEYNYKWMKGEAYENDPENCWNTD